MRFNFLFLLVFLGLLAGPLPPSRAADLTLTGKLVCSLKRAILLPYPAEIVSLEVKPGEEVRQGQVLGRYRLLPEAVQALARRLSPPQLQELEARVTEAEKALATLRGKEKGLRELARQNLASPQSVVQLERELKAAARQQGILASSLARERSLLQEDRRLLSRQLGVPVSPGQVPGEGVFLAPVPGRVLWLHPDLRAGAELKGPEPVLMVGRLDPMLLKARVHEIEALQLKEGQKAEVSLEALPGKTFEGRLSRLPWAPPALSLEHPTYYEVEFEVANPELVLREGLKATLTLASPSGPKH
jgi:multidrug resistance efflux pump